jgi:prolyl-tRNA editing enzyme YbaK/EbsC (Cys-tRNA(Pro) deacylase)
MDDNSKFLERLNQLLNEAGVTYQFIAHDETIHSAQQGAEEGLGSISEMAPTFILASEQGYLAAVIRGDTRLSYKKIKKELGLKNVALATPDQVKQVTGAQVGQVSLINPGLVAIVDPLLLEKEKVYGGCGVPRRTLVLNPYDLVKLTGARVFDFTEKKVE